MTEQPTRPDLHIGFLGAGVTLFLMSVFAVVGIIGIPADAEVPMHWNMHGEADRFGGKWEAILTMPLIAVGLNALLAVLPYLDPRRLNMVRSAKAYSMIWVATNGIFVAIYVIKILDGLGWSLPVSNIVGGIIGLLYLVMGNYLQKTRSNFFFGIRTPWTLSSERSWTLTHRRGGKLFMALGCLILVFALFGATTLEFIALVGGTFGLTGYLAYYSYVLWRDDPDKIAVGGEPSE